MKGFKLQCEKCKNEDIYIKGTAIKYGAKVKVIFICSICGNSIEAPIIQTSFNEMSNFKKQ